MSSPELLRLELSRQNQPLNLPRELISLDANSSELGLVTGIYSRRQWQAGLGDKNKTKALRAWTHHSRQTLTFPFRAKVFDAQTIYALRDEAKVTIIGFAGRDEMYDLLVPAQSGHDTFVLPLCGVEVIPKYLPTIPPRKVAPSGLRIGKHVHCPASRPMAISD